MEDDSQVNRFALDVSTLDQVFLRHKAMLLRIAHRKLRNPAHAEDMVQQTFLRAWSAKASFRGEALPSTWLTRILYNEILQFQRKADEQRLQFYEDSALIEGEAITLPTGAGLSPEENCIDAQRSLLVRQVAARLPSLYRDVVLLDLYSELTTEEMSKRLNLSISAVKSRCMRGRAELFRRVRHRVGLPLSA